MFSLEEDPIYPNTFRDMDESYKTFIEALEQLSPEPRMNYLVKKKDPLSIDGYPAYSSTIYTGTILTTKDISIIAKKAFEYLKEGHDYSFSTRIRFLSSLEKSLDKYATRIETSAQRHWWNRLLSSLGFRSIFGKPLKKPTDIVELQHSIQTTLSDLKEKSSQAFSEYEKRCAPLFDFVEKVSQPSLQGTYKECHCFLKGCQELYLASLRDGTIDLVSETMLKITIRLKEAFEIQLTKFGPLFDEEPQAKTKQLTEAIAKLIDNTICAIYDRIKIINTWINTGLKEAENNFYEKFYLYLMKKATYLPPIEERPEFIRDEKISELTRMKKDLLKIVIKINSFSYLKEEKEALDFEDLAACFLKQIHTNALVLLHFLKEPLETLQRPDNWDLDKTATKFVRT